MKEKNDMDRILRDSVGNFRPEPDPASKRKFLAEAPAVLGRRRGGGSGWMLMIIGLVAILITGTLIYTAIFDSNPVFSPDNQGAFAITDNGSNPSGGLQSRPVTENDLQPGQPGDPGIAKEIGKETEAAGIPAVPELMIPETKVISGETTREAAETTSMDGSFPVVRTSVLRRNDLLTGMSAIYRVMLIDETQADEAPGKPLARNVSPLSATPAGPVKMRPHVSYGIFYKPDMMFRIIDDNKVVHSAGAEVQVRFADPRFLVRTGLGLSFSKGFNEYSVSYNEYLGSYMRLDSVTFSLGENNFDLIPQVHQSEQQVFDTAVEALPAKTYQRFTYLQIPLTGGYDFINKRNLSVGARLGAVMSVMLSSSLGQVSYDAGANQVIGVDQVTPERNLLNWQAVAGVTFTLRGPKRSYIELEPAFSYYLNAIHQEATGPDHPYSIGLRIAAGIK